MRAGECPQRAERAERAEGHGGARRLLRVLRGGRAARGRAQRERGARARAKEERGRGDEGARERWGTSGERHFGEFGRRIGWIDMPLFDPRGRLLGKEMWIERTGAPVDERCRVVTVWLRTVGVRAGDMSTVNISAMPNGSLNLRLSKRLSASMKRFQQQILSHSTREKGSLRSGLPVEENRKFLQLHRNASSLLYIQ